MTRPFVRNSAATILAVLIGMANPIFCAPASMAEVSPMTCPSAFTKGPPLLPGLIGALSWMR